MVLMMVLPLILLVLLPKILNDPEAKKEMENLQLPKMGEGLPDMSEMLSRLMGGGQPQQRQQSSSGGGSSGERARNKKRNN